MADADPQPMLPDDFASTKPSMGDPEFVDGQVRAMLTEVTKALFEADPKSDPRTVVGGIALKYADRFWAGNTNFTQTMTPEAQFVWLQEHGLGTEDADQKGPITCLVASTVTRFVEASKKYAADDISDDQFQFQLDATVEDCWAMLLGIENPGD